jgi:putative copper export protein
MTFLHTLSLLLHLIALAAWLGGIAFFLIVFAPAVHELEPGIGIRALNRGRISLEAISWAAIGILFLTGIANLVLRMQATGAPMTTSYAALLSIKLFLFFAMLVHHCLQVFKYGPRIASLTPQVDRHEELWPEPLLSYWRRWFLLLKINAVLGPVAVLLGLMLNRS